MFCWVIIFVFINVVGISNLVDVGVVGDCIGGGYWSWNGINRIYVWDYFFLKYEV